MEKKTKVIVALVVMIAIIGSVIYFYMKKKKADALKESSETLVAPVTVKPASKWAGKKLDKSKMVSAKAIGKPAEAIFLSNE
jgi:cell division protein FtsN